MKLLFVLVLLINDNPETIVIGDQYLSLKMCIQAKKEIIENAEEKDKEELKKRLGCMVNVDPTSLKKPEES